MGIWRGEEIEEAVMVRDAFIEKVVIVGDYSFNS